MSLLYFLLWILLNGRITVEILLFGLLFAVLMTLFSRRIMDYDGKKNRVILRNFPLLLLYVLVLIGEIIRSSFAVMTLMFSRKRRPDPVILEFRSGLESDFQNVLLANSITLTPGTFTLRQEGDCFTVHCLRPEFFEGIEDSSFIRLLRKLR